MIEYLPIALMIALTGFCLGRDATRHGEKKVTSYNFWEMLLSAGIWWALWIWAWLWMM